MKKKDLRGDVIYHLVNDTEGLKICVIESNRNDKAKNKKMLEGCVSEGMQQPGIFTDARLALEAGYKLLDVKDSHEVTVDEVDDYLVIADGNTRFHAYQFTWTAPKDGKFEYIFHYKAYADKDTFQKAYRKMNVYNNPTKACDFARDLVATTKNKVLISYQNKQKDGLVAKAAGFATIGREIIKKDMEMLQNGATPSGFNNQKDNDRFERLYMVIKQRKDLFKKAFAAVPIWTYNANKLNGVDEDKRDGVLGLLIKLYETMTADCLNKILEAKADGFKKKEVIIHGILDEAMKAI